MLLLQRITNVFHLFSIYQQVLRNYLWKIVALVLLGFLGGLLEGIGIGVLVPLFSLIVNSSPSQDIFSQSITKLFSYFQIAPHIWTLILFISFLFIFKAVVQLIFSYFTALIAAQYENRNRRELYQAVLESRWGYLLKQKIGYLENVLMVDMGGSSSLLRKMGSIIQDAASFLVYAAVAINISFPITIITLFAGGAIFFASRPLLSRVKIYAKAQEILNKQIAHQINEGMLGFKTIKFMSAEGSVARRASALFENLKRIVLRRSLAKGITAASLETFGLLFVMGLFLFAYYFQPNFNLAAFIVIMYLVQKIFINVNNTQKSLQMVIEAVPHVEAVLRLEQKAKLNQEGDSESLKKPFQFGEKFEFRHVYFSYDGSNGDVLSNINFTVPKGEMVGIVGPSGMGKTTIADLVLRLFEPTGGEILVDGVLISEFNMADWRRNIGYVSQDIFLKNDTIENNIKFYDERIDRNRVIEAAKEASCYDFIMRLPKGLEAVVGERGVMFSQGQRQRIVLARALARDPKILVLDEATSAVDNESERLIQQALENLRGKVTILIIAHRLSTVMHCDRILVLKEGRIIEEGTPTHLLANQGSYFHHMYQRI